MTSLVVYYLYDKAVTERMRVYTIPEVVELIWPTPETIRDKTLDASEGWETIADYKIIMTVSNDLMREIKGQHDVIPQIQVNSMKPFLMESVPVKPMVLERTTSTWGPIERTTSFLPTSSIEIHLYIQTILRKTDENTPAQRLYRVTDDMGRSFDDYDSMEAVKEDTKKWILGDYRRFIHSQTTGIIICTD